MNFPISKETNREYDAKDSSTMNTEMVSVKYDFTHQINAGPGYQKKKA